MNLYCVSGLGGGAALFGKIRVPNIRIIHLDWIEPRPKETMEEYAARFVHGIDTHSPFALMGVSFGGMLVLEMAKHLPHIPVIQISSMRTPEQLPWYLRMGRYFPIYKWLPNSYGPGNSYLMRWAFDIRDKEREAFAEMINKSDPDFVKWAMEAVLHWPGARPPRHWMAIHGDQDRVLPAYDHAHQIIPGGGHWIIRQEARLINPLLQKYLETWCEAQVEGSGIFD